MEAAKKNTPLMDLMLDNEKWSGFSPRLTDKELEEAIKAIKKKRALSNPELKIESIKDSQRRYKLFDEIGLDGRY